MVQLETAELVEGKGIKSTDGQKDRYFGAQGEQLRGAYPNNKVRQLSLISWDAIEKANRTLDIPYGWAETRRNIVIAGISAEELNELKDQLFQLGDSQVLGTELCDPCDRPDKLSGKKGFKKAFTNAEGISIGGLRVEIRKSGIISVGSSVIF